MRDKQKKAQYDITYAKEHIKRIPLNVQHEQYDIIKAAADRAGETVSGYIKTAVNQRIERERV